MRVLIFDSQADFYVDALTKSVPELSFCGSSDIDVAMQMATDCEALVGLAPYLSSELLDAMPRLQWVQALTTGVDNLLGRDGLAVSNCGGIHGPQMSELALLQMLALSRRFPQMLANQRAHHWDRQPQPLLLGKTACILGLGAITEHLAGVLKAFGMSVTGVSGGRTSAPGIDKVYPREQICAAVGAADFVVVLTPYSQSTHHIVDQRVLAAMRRSSYLVNIARGGCVDEDALSVALRTGSIAGAALDVFAQSPLPADSELWELPNLIITPHIGGFADCYHEQALPIITANMLDFARGGVAALTGGMEQ